MIRSMLAVLLLLCSLTANASSLPCAEAGAKRHVPAAYVAADGKRLEACFNLDDHSVALQLPDGVLTSLPAALSGSGARYSDGKQTFWEHQGTARYLVGEELLFEGKTAAKAEYGTGVSSKLLIKTGLTADGRKIAYPVTDQPEVTALTVELAPGAETGWHKHTIPVYGYVLSGAIDVELEGGKTCQYKAGDAIIEVVNTFHNGRNRGLVPVSLVVFYTGIQGVPNVIKKPHPSIR